MKKTTLFCVLIVMSFGTLRPALADIDIPEEPIKGGYDLSRFEFTIGPTVLKEHGFGVAARILADPIGLEGGFAYMPWFVILMGACEHFDVLFKMHVDGSLLIRLANIKDKMRVLLKLG